MKGASHSKSSGLNRLAFQAMKKAIKKVIEENRRLGLPLWVSKNGRVMKLSPKTLKPIKNIHEEKVLRAAAPFFPSK